MVVSDSGVGVGVAAGLKVGCWLVEHHCSPQLVK